MRPIVLKPAIKDIIWGGTRLKTDFGYPSDGERIAEAWVVSAHPNGESVAVGGSFDGLCLSEILRRHPEYAPGCEGGFPLLIKFIDAERDLSIQVHPDDARAALDGGGRGKTEMWYVMDAAPGSGIYYGFNHACTAEEFSAAVADGSICGLLNKKECRAGDVYFIPAGTVHAIGGGLLICEIQQSSDITYRIFDYNRPGADGKPRQLHVEQAARAADFSPSQPDGKPLSAPRSANGAVVTRLAECEFFKTAKYEVTARTTGICGAGFELLTVLDGNAKLQYSSGEVDIKKGDGVFLPAGLGKYRISGKITYIKTTL